MFISGATAVSEEAPNRDNSRNKSATELVSACYPTLLAFMKRRTGDAMLAEDLAQEAVLVLLERLAREPLDDPGAVGGYLRQTALYLHIGRIREGERRATDCRATLPERAAGDGPFASRLAQERRRELLRRIEALPTPRDRALLRLYLLEQRGKVRICQELGVSEAHFKRVLSRAKRRLLAVADPSSAPVGEPCLRGGSRVPTDSCRSTPPELRSLAVA